MITLLTEEHAAEIAERASLMALEKVEERYQPAPVWLNIKQVCDYLGFSETKVRDLMKRGLPFSDKGGDKRFYRPDVDSYMRGDK